MKSKYMIFIVCSSTVSFPNYVHMLSIQDIIRNTAQHWHTLHKFRISFWTKNSVAAFSWHRDSPCTFYQWQSPQALSSSLPEKQQKWKLLSLVWLFATPLNYAIHGILQARILEWVVFLFSRGSSQPRDQTQVSRTAGGFFTSWATREAQEYWSESVQELNWGLLHCRCFFVLFCFLINWAIKQALRKTASSSQQVSECTNFPLPW